MNNKKITIISILVTTNILTALIAFTLYIVISIGAGDLIDEEKHHLSLKVEKLKNHILSENKGLTVDQFMKKYNIEKEREKFEIESNAVGYNLLYFEFKDGVLNDIE